MLCERTLLKSARSTLLQAFAPALAILLMAFLFVVAAAPLAAQDAAPDAPVTANEVNEVAKELWCPLCSGVRLDACELKACDQMKDVIADKLTEGEDAQSIKKYFLAQYGPQVLGEPPMEGFNWLAWVLPVVVLVIGGLFVWSRVHTMMRTPQPAAPTGGPNLPGDSGDTYNRRLEEELKQYD